MPSEGHGHLTVGGACRPTKRELTTHMSGKNAFVCIHGHFYQPPRENPWLDEVLCEPSAAPYHDWNRRITRECYGPNSCARIPGPDGGIRTLVSNYEQMSFNFGPTLLSWLSRHDPWVYGRILEADRRSTASMDGHGNAIAQVYNHIIMPLASTRDKRTQILWGIADFRHRFGRFPEGMWLAETAVDSETLALMAEEGILYTILCPNQAAAIRPLAAGASGGWRETGAGKIDTSRPYRVFPSVREDLSIAVFFYDEQVSRSVAYERLLASGEQFLSRIKERLENGTESPRLLSVATDGESYGHHFKFGDMALAWLYGALEKSPGLSAVNFGAFLERFPPEYEAGIIEASAWSCAHGVERWRSDCGCSVAGKPGWNQAWRGPLRHGLDRLSIRLGEIFEASGRDVFFDPWAARDAYVGLLLNSSEDCRRDFLDEHVRGGPEGPRAVDALRLLESQRMALYMFTSCGWFFDDISGLESVQVLMYAARAMDLVSGRSGEDLEARLKDDLSAAESNRAGIGTGADVYEKKVAPARLTPTRLAAHVVCARVPERPAGPSSLFAGVTGRLEVEGGPGAARGTVRVVEPYIRFLHDFLFVCTDEGCRIEPLGGEAEPSQPEKDETANFLYRDLLPAALHEIVDARASYVDSEISAVLGKSDPGLMELIGLIDPETRSCLTPECRQISGLAIRHQIRKAFEALCSAENLQPGVLASAGGAAEWKIFLDLNCMASQVQQALSRHMEELSGLPVAGRISRILQILKWADIFDLPVDLWEAQNRYYYASMIPGFRDGLPAGEVPLLDELGKRLGFR